MEELEHLPLPVYKKDLRRKKLGGGSTIEPPKNRSKYEFAKEQISVANSISEKFIKQRDEEDVETNLIFEVKLNNKVDTETYEKQFENMDLDVLSVTEDKIGNWVVFSSDDQLEKFKEKIEFHGKEGAENSPKYDFFNAIDGIEDVPVEKKFPSPQFLEELPKKGEFYFNVELWRIGDEQINSFVEGITKKFKNFEITDKLVKTTFVLLRVKTNRDTLTKLVEYRDVAQISKPQMQKFDEYEIYRKSVDDFDRVPPPENAAGILIIDSGLVPNHPLIGQALGDEANFQNVESDTIDRVGHGTAVAGCALYGHIEHCIERNQFYAGNWLFSAKVMYKSADGSLTAEYDPKELLETQLESAVRYFLENNENNIKVVNLSLGNSEEIWNDTFFRQTPLASLIDELAREFNDVVFIISIGNQDPFDVYDGIEEVEENYPNYLIDEEKTIFNLISPATSALALSVGSISNTPKVAESFAHKPDVEIYTEIAKENQPSPFTRVGPGLNGMIKPELVEYGGNLVVRDKHDRIQKNYGGKITVLSKDYPGRLFCYDYGTSFSAPKVARCCALISNEYLDRSSNFIKNLILQSASFPGGKIDKEFWNADKPERAEKNRLRSMGYGVPNEERAKYSYENSVLLFDEGSIQIDTVKVFTVKLPDDFFQIKGDRIFSVALTYDPQTNRMRGDNYIGNSLEFKVFHSVSPDDVISKISKEDEDESKEKTDFEDKYQLEFRPTVTIRSVGCHQKAMRNLSHVHWQKNPFSKLCIALISKRKWRSVIKDDFLQNYCISLYVHHNNYAELYSELKNLNKVEIQEKARIR